MTMLDWPAAHDLEDLDEDMPDPQNKLNGPSDDTDMRIQMAVMATEFRNLTSRLSEFEKKLDGLAVSFVTKPELSILDNRVRKLESSLDWTVKIVIGAVLLAILGLVLVKGGVPHP